MNRLALVLTAAGLLRLAAAGKALREDNADPPGSIRGDGGVSNPSPADQAALCSLVRVGRAEGHAACQHRLSRRNFNANPFGLRFGKRVWTERPRPRSSKPLPYLPSYLLYLRDVRLPA
ncbi:Kisspeptin 2 precursor [Arapaima gigas]